MRGGRRRRRIMARQGVVGVLGGRKDIHCREYLRELRLLQGQAGRGGGERRWEVGCRGMMILFLYPVRVEMAVVVVMGEARW